MTANKLLQTMQLRDQEMLLAKSQMIQIPAREKLEEPFFSNPFVYFLESGFASILYKGRGDYQVDVSLIGREGFTGAALVLGVDRAPQALTMQVAGSGFRIARDVLSEILEQSHTLRVHLSRFIHALIVQRDESALAASRGTLPQRLARSILIMQDRLEYDEIPVTHEAIAFMLGVRRAGVTTALGSFVENKIIASHRGSIYVLDRQALLDLSAPFYGAYEADLLRVFGS